jgi:hypothetical protein
MDPQQPPDLPADPLLEVIARCDDDVETVVRCAAVSKPLRRAILDPGFHRRLGLRAEANGGFDPNLLVAASYRLRARYIRSDPFLVQKTGGRLRFDTDLLRSFEPASSSRDGLLVLRRIHEGIGIQIVDDVELLVCNTITGHATSIPRMDVRGPSGHIRSDIYSPVLLSTDGGGRSFELLVMYSVGGWAPPTCREVQIFSSQEAVWGAARQIQMPEDVELVRATSTAPAVIGRSIHWLACNDIAFPAFRDGDMFVLALHADEGVQATVIKLPQELLASIGRSCGGPSSVAHNLILTSTAARQEGKRLSVVVAEKLAISVWTLEPAEEGSPSSWSRQEVIRRREIGRQLTAIPDAYQSIRFDAFGERSGTVLFWVEGAGLVQLNLGTKKAIVLWKGSGVINYRTSKALVHEVDLISMLQCMKPF